MFRRKNSKHVRLNSEQIHQTAREFIGQIEHSNDALDLLKKLHTLDEMRP